MILTVALPADAKFFDVVNDNGTLKGYFRWHGNDVLGGVCGAEWGSGTNEFAPLNSTLTSGCGLYLDTDYTWYTTDHYFEFTPTEGCESIAAITGQLQCSYNGWNGNQNFSIDTEPLNTALNPPPPPARTASSALDEVVSAAATQTAGVTIFAIENYWAYILVISIIGGLIAAFHRRMKIWK